MNELLKLIREAAGPQVWSRAVNLSREDAVLGESANAEEVVLSVKGQPGPKRYQVVLYLEDEDWSCTCPSTADACEHVAAAIIALNQARKAGNALPGARRTGRLHYRFYPEGDALGLERSIVFDDGTREALSGSLARDGGRDDLVVNDDDLAVDVALGGKRAGAFPRGVLAKVIPRLVGLPVTFGDKAIEVGKAHPGLRAVVEDVPEGYRARIEQDPEVKQVFRNGALRLSDSIRPLKDIGLEGGLVQALRSGKFYSRRDVAALASELIPKLEAAMPVEVSASLVPTAERSRPRLSFDTTSDGHQVSVLASVVYGDPPIARLDGDTLTLLGAGPAPVRDRKRESALLTHLRSELGLEPSQRLRFSPSDAMALGARIENAAIPIQGGAPDFASWGVLTPEIEVGTGLQARFSVGGRGASGPAVLEAWLAGEDHVPLIDGGFAELPHDWIDRYGHRLYDLLSAQRNNDVLPPAARVEAAFLLEDLGAPTPPDLRELIRSLGSAPELPDDLRATLRPYQHEGVRWLGSLKSSGLGALLADDMGLGKTLQTICTLEKPSLIVAPTSVLDNWKSEIAKFRPALTAALYHGPNRALADVDVLITTYAILRLDIEALSARRWRVVVLDEAQAIKNPSSQSARAAYQLPGDFRVSLSGTPVENRLDELWSQMHFTNPGLLGTQREFQERYSKPISSGDESAGSRLRARLKPFLKRRLKREVATDLPPRTDLVLHCELTDSERAIYDAVRLATVKEVVAKFGAGASPLAALEALLRLRQAACHPSLLPDEHAATSSKVQLLVETLEAALVDGHKALVFSQWTSLLDLVADAIGERRYLRLDGATRDRAAVVDAFQSDGGPELMLISLKAGGTGLNLTAADYVFLLDPWWNPAAEDQAADRAHRIGQDKPVFVHRLVSRDTVEEKILDLQARKRSLADAAVGAGAFNSALTRDELMELLA
ncbi:MAG: DEAD/DEAH box helicase [Myxococcota bacterium]